MNILDQVPPHDPKFGAIEQDADVVLFAHRREDRDGEICKLIVAKHRNGRLQSFPMRWDGPRFEFKESEFGHGEEFDPSDHAFDAFGDYASTNIMDETSCD